MVPQIWSDYVPPINRGPVAVIPEDTSTASGKEELIILKALPDEKLATAMVTAYRAADDKDSMANEIIATLDAAAYIRDSSYGDNLPEINLKMVLELREFFHDIDVNEEIFGIPGLDLNYSYWQQIGKSFGNEPGYDAGKVSSFQAYGTRTAFGDILLAFNAASIYTSAMKFKYVNNLGIGQQLTRNDLYRLGLEDANIPEGNLFVIVGYSFGSSKQGTSRYLPEGIYDKDNPLNPVYLVDYQIAPVKRVGDNLTVVTNDNSYVSPTINLNNTVVEGSKPDETVQSVSTSATSTYKSGVSHNGTATNVHISVPPPVINPISITLNR